MWPIYQCGYCFNPFGDIGFTHGVEKADDLYGKNVAPLYLIFNSDFNSKDSADTHIVSSKELLSEVKSRSEYIGGDKILGENGFYSKALFESVEEAYTTLEITAGVNKD